MQSGETQLLYSNPQKTDFEIYLSEWIGLLYIWIYIYYMCFDKGLFNKKIRLFNKKIKFREMSSEFQSFAYFENMKYLFFSTKIFWEIEMKRQLVLFLPLKCIFIINFIIL